MTFKLTIITLKTLVLFLPFILYCMEHDEYQQKIARLQGDLKIYRFYLENQNISTLPPVEQIFIDNNGILKKILISREQFYKSRITDLTQELHQLTQRTPIPTPLPNSQFLQPPLQSLPITQPPSNSINQSCNSLNYNHPPRLAPNQTLEQAMGILGVQQDSPTSYVKKRKEHPTTPSKPPKKKKDNNFKNYPYRCSDDNQAINSLLKKLQQRGQPINHNDYFICYNCPTEGPSDFLKYTNEQALNNHILDYHCNHNKCRYCSLRYMYNNPPCQGNDTRKHAYLNPSELLAQLTSFASQTPSQPAPTNTSQYTENNNIQQLFNELLNTTLMSTCADKNGYTCPFIHENIRLYTTLKDLKKHVLRDHLEDSKCLYCHIQNPVSHHCTKNSFHNSHTYPNLSILYETLQSLLSNPLQPSYRAVAPERADNFKNYPYTIGGVITEPTINEAIKNLLRLIQEKTIRKINNINSFNCCFDHPTEPHGIYISTTAREMTEHILSNHCNYNKCIHCNLTHMYNNPPCTKSNSKQHIYLTSIEILERLKTLYISLTDRIEQV